MRGHQGVRCRIGVRPGCFQARPGPRAGAVHADEMLAVGAAPGLVDQAAIGLVGQDAAPRSASHGVQRPDRPPSTL